MHGFIRSIYLVVALLAVTFAPYANANAILANYSITPTDSGSRLLIEFNQPVSYLSHFPKSRGSSVDIKLRPILSSSNTSESNSVIEELSIAQHSPATVTSIKYEQDTVQQGSLTIEYTERLSFTIKPSRDRRSLTIDIISKSKSVSTKKTSAQVTTDLPIYVINLSTASSPIDSRKQPALAKYNSYDIYTTTSQVNWKNKHHLRLGYFYSKRAAEANLKVLKPFYKNAWVDSIRPERRSTAEKWFLSRKISNVQKSPASNKARKQGKPDKINNLMERGKQAMIDKNYRKAIRYFSRILEYKNSTHHQEARELLGLARERNNQFAHAKAEYQQYLRDYPEGEDAERVKQRLRGLITARSKDKKELKKSGVRGAEPEWNTFGSLSQFYRHQVSGTDTTDNQTIDSSLLSDLVYSGRKRGLEWNQRFDIVANHRYDFLNELEASNGNIYTMFYDIADKENDYAMRIGRQTHNSDGVLGRFDGIILRKRLGKNSRFSLLAGYPVELSIRDNVNTDRQFYAASLHFESLFENTDAKLYYIDQENHGLIDRNAVGTEIQYIGNNATIFFLLDYDLHFADFNQATFVGNWRAKDNSTLNIVADMRNSPLLTTNNALIGQTVTTLEQLQASFNEDEIKKLAQDRTADFWSFTISGTKPLSDRYQANADITISNLGDTPASGGVEATTGTGNEYFYNLSLIANGFFVSNDITIMGLRYNDAATSSTLGAHISTRFKSSKPWRWNPRLSVDQRSDDNGSERTTYKTRLIVNYQPNREWRYELELGYEASETTSLGITTNEETYYTFLGYIHDF